VSLVWDKDAAGRTHALTVARSLNGVGATVRFMRARGSTNKDVSNHLAAGFSLKELQRKRTAPVKPRRRSSEESSAALPAMYQLVVPLLHDHATRRGLTLPRRHSDEEAWEACCPAHDDREPSLSVRVGDRRAVALRCHAGCSAEAVSTALGINWHELSTAPVPLAAKQHGGVAVAGKAKRSWPAPLGPAARREHNTPRAAPRPAFHDLRHTCASLAIERGAHPKLIQTRLGHEDIRTTLNVYGHMFPSAGPRWRTLSMSASTRRRTGGPRRTPPS
jgi:hypothetical protein